MKSCYFVANILRCSIRKKSSERGFFCENSDFLSCNTGEGHNAAGHAVEEAALARGHEVNFVDAMQLGKKTYFTPYQRTLYWDCKSICRGFSVSFINWECLSVTAISNLRFTGQMQSWRNRLHPSSKKEIMTLW